MHNFTVNVFLEFPSHVFISSAAAKEMDVASIKLRLPPHKLVLGLLRGYIEETVPGHIRNGRHQGAGGGLLATDYADISILDILFPPEPRKVFLLMPPECRKAIGDFLNHSGHFIHFNEWRMRAAR